jgi:Leucine-rich repeat (LRR) protein
MGKGDRLTSLILSENLIKTIEDNAFSDMSLLQTLDLRNNKLTYLSESTFAGLSSLIDIWLDHNLITDLSDGKIFAGSPKLQYLSMDWTPLKSVDNQTFDGLSNLIELSIDHGELSMLPEGTFKSLSNLKTLSMRHNQFRVIPQEELVWLKQLEHLDLSGNPIVTITSNAFRFNGHLHELLMSNMPDLNYVEDCAFCNLHELSTLQITNSSKFVDIDPEAFGRDQMYFQSLITVDLVNNSLTELDEDLLPWENITGMIRLGGNRWKCMRSALDDQYGLEIRFLGSTDLRNSVKTQRTTDHLVGQVRTRSVPRQSSQRSYTSRSRVPDRGHLDYHLRIDHRDLVRGKQST